MGISTLTFGFSRVLRSITQWNDDPQVITMKGNV
jgi:hypothetical protein